jgi:dTDP-D-glucose 4,6-dehydratase
VTETTATSPTNPYAASKAAAEQFVEAYRQSYGMPTIVTRGNNVYGAHQYPEKVIPKFILRLRRGLSCCLHGSGASVRNFLHVDDVAAAFMAILAHGAVGEVYNIGTSEGVTMRSLAERLVRLAHPDEKDVSRHIECVEDRAFNDMRYDISTSKLHALGWRPQISFDEGLRHTHDWYCQPDVEARWGSGVEAALRPHPTRS